MKILHVIQSLRPSNGGPPHQLAELVTGLQRRDVENVVLTWAPTHDRRYLEQIEASGGVVVELTSITTRHPISAQLVSTLPRLARQADVVHLWGYWGFHTLVYCYRAERVGTPFAISALGSLPIFLHSRLKKRIFALIAGRRLLSRADLAIAISVGEERRYIAEGVAPERVKVIPIAVPDDFFCRVAPQPRQERSKVCILFLGRLHEKKGLQFMLPILAELHRERHDFHLDVVGPDDGYQHKLEHMVAVLGLQDCVTFHGAAYGEDKIAYFRNAEIFVLPSMLEQIGHAILEGAAAGLACVYTRGCEFPALAAAGGGFETDGSHGELLATMRALVADRELRARMGMKARNCIGSGYLWSQVRESYLKAYAAIAKDRSVAAKA
jgi:glycosyltransferase involved in cell wall biosynthesis